MGEAFGIKDDVTVSTLAGFPEVFTLKEESGDAQ